MPPHIDGGGGHTNKDVEYLLSNNIKLFGSDQMLSYLASDQDHGNMQIPVYNHIAKMVVVVVE